MVRYEEEVAIIVRVNVRVRLRVRVRYLVRYDSEERVADIPNGTEPVVCHNMRG